MKVWVFGGWDFDDNTLDASDFVELGYAQGVLMGGSLNAEQVTAAPQMLMGAEMDAKHAKLDRVHVIKGWVDSAAAQHEQVYNAAWAGERILDGKGKLPAIGNTGDIGSGLGALR